MRKVFYSHSAEDDIEELSACGLATHGYDRVILYNKLILYTVDQLRLDPVLQKTTPFCLDIRRVHLRKYKHLVVHKNVTVQSPSHYIFYRVLHDDSLEIVRILREGRSYEKHLLG